MEKNLTCDKYIVAENSPGYDVYGQRLSMDITESVSCPVCTRQVAVTRFAPHLEKCMGLKTSRVARIKKPDGLSLSQKNADDGDDVHEDEDYDSLEQMDQDDTYSERKKKDQKKNNTNRRRKKKDEDISSQSQAIE
ncbi:hypothetical protein O9G_002939 [Rozella allomycis CSF55]|uniref:SAGA-associated factor 11 n=1 Tax=Rozella allomycis (strain CSF55) TaxID=988480 RepID=A0A075ANK4_ROZAC|nr:hypothetical protein O9G_002939 [Rozella allomycis CSF55]|eukprot:EPZ31470.1 hypothetical protein O9G_002939 [Rozella allomycis CSF55]